MRRDDASGARQEGERETLFLRGGRNPQLNEDLSTRIFQGDEILVDLRLGGDRTPGFSRTFDAEMEAGGVQEATVVTIDLNAEYCEINGSYRS